MDRLTKDQLKELIRTACEIDFELDQLATKEKKLTLAVSKYVGKPINNVKHAIDELLMCLGKIEFQDEE